MKTVSAASEIYSGGMQPSRSGGRSIAIDFIKGALVLIMVLYHWMNFFLDVDPSVYRFLRFLTPSFIFITGFLVSHVYLSKYPLGDRSGSRRLQLRGVKLLALVAVLNLLINATHLKGLGRASLGIQVAGSSLSYLLGFQPLAFSVLMPIAYLLIMSGWLLPIAQRHAHIFHEACAFVLTVCVICDFIGVKTGYLDLVGIGLLGASVGHIAISKIDAALGHPIMIGAFYLIYLCAIIRWNVIYPLQIVAVCINLAVLYWLGLKTGSSRIFGDTIVRLGKYSLFAYIFQILILHLMRRVMGLDDIGMPFFALVAGASCTIVSVEVLDRERHKMPRLNRWYSAVFA